MTSPAVTVTVQKVPPRRLAGVRRRVTIGAVGAAWKPALDLVWAFLRAHPGLRADGHNGEVAMAVHVGPYDQLRRAHDAIHAWRAETGRAFAGTSWEIYGDGSDDPSKLETTVCYLLAAPAPRK